MLAAMKVAVLCVVALAGAVKAGSGSGSSGSGSGSELEPDTTTLAPTTGPTQAITTKADYTHSTTLAPTAPPAANATTAPSGITTGFNAGRLGHNDTTAADADTTTAAAASNATAADADTTAAFTTVAAADTTAAAADTTAAAADATAAPAADADTTAAAAATQAPAASAGTTVAPKMIERKEERQSAKFAVSMEKDDCDKLQKSPEDVKKTAEAVAAAANVDTKIDFGASKSKCVAPGRRQRRAAVNLEVTLVFKKDVSAADVAAAVAVANELIKAGVFEVTVTIGGESKTIKVTQTVTQATEVVTVMVPNPAYVPVNGTTATAQPGTTTNAVVNTPKASASLARGSALLVAALAASHALLA